MFCIFILKLIIYTKHFVLYCFALTQTAFNHQSQYKLK